MLLSWLAVLAVLAGNEPAHPVEVWPDATWPRATAAEAGLDPARLEAVRDYALSGGGSGCIVRSGRLVLTWGDQKQRYDLKSSTKSLGATALGLAVADGKIALGDRARKHHPALGVPPESNAATGWLDEITILHLATQTAGFEKPGGFGKLLFRPGTKWAYSDGGPNWLAECITLAYQRDVNDLMFERVFTPLGITPADLVWRKNGYRPALLEGIPRREFGSGISADVDALARVGLLYLRQGRWRDHRILPADFVDTARTTANWVKDLPVVDPSNYGKAAHHYGLLWWNNADGTLAGVPRDAFWSWGLYDSLIVVIPSLDLVAARAGKSWARKEGADHYDVLRPFLEQLAGSVRTAAVDSEPPYPPSRAIVGIDWAPAASIVRRAEGSDNWPLTWGDDDAMYTAYGDGRGFRPFVPRKLSLGMARITGSPEDFRGRNIPAPTGERLGDGASGPKASGILMVDGVLYLWTRNTGNAQLAWSDDHGRSWTWAPWRLTESFGCPTFLNFGKNYAGARDRYVYVYSHDNPSAYESSDRMVLARVPRDRIRERNAYEFYTGSNSTGQPLWSGDIAARGAVFRHAGQCGRSSISYDPALGRYLWVQILGGDARFRGGLGIYDAPEPWGPWTTVYLRRDWDTAPGESASLPTRWMSDDGRTVHLVFSGQDAFSVRRARLVVPAER